MATSKHETRHALDQLVLLASVGTGATALLGTLVEPLSGLVWAIAAVVWVLLALALREVSAVPAWRRYAASALILLGLAMLFHSWSTWLWTPETLSAAPLGGLFAGGGALASGIGLGRSRLSRTSLLFPATVIGSLVASAAVASWVRSAPAQETLSGCGFDEVGWQAAPAYDAYETLQFAQRGWLQVGSGQSETEDISFAYRRNRDHSLDLWDWRDESGDDWWPPDGRDPGRVRVGVVTESGRFTLRWDQPGGPQEKEFGCRMTLDGAPTEVMSTTYYARPTK